MSKDTSILSEVAIFVAGVLAVGIMSGGRRRDGSRTDSPELKDLQRAVGDLETRIAGQESANAARFSHLEARLDEHSARLADVPSTQQIVGAMEQLLSKTLTQLDDRMTTQARSIEVLKTTVSQTDSLLERV